jgi:hypothetical protein
VWEATVRAERSVTVSATPEAVWAIASSPRAWSARPDHCLSFGLAERQWFLIGVARGQAVAGVLQVADEQPGRLICLQPAHGRLSWTLSVAAARGGARLRIAQTQQVPRQLKIDAEMKMRDEIKAWLDALRAIAEGRAPLPAEAVPEGLSQVLRAPAGAASLVEASASVHVNAPPERIGRALASLDIARAAQSAEVVYCGHLPGTPADQVGGVRYFVYRMPDGRLFAVASLIAAASPTALMTRHVTAPYGEAAYSFEAAGDGTLLSISWRQPSAGPPGPDAIREQRVTELAGRYKAAIEGAPHETDHAWR